MTYTKQTWKNLPDQTTPVSAARLNHLETQFDEAKAYTDQQISANQGSEGPEGPRGPEGPQGPPGDQGDPGEPGEAAVISGVTASQLPVGSVPTVTAGGTPSDRTFEFGIPQGPQGEKGQDGTSVTIKGSLPGVGSLPESGQPGDAWMISGNLWVWTGLDWENVGPIQGPKGDPGTNGTSATIESATATGLTPGAQPTVTLGGTPSARTMNFGIPKGDPGAPGVDGSSGTITGTSAETISYGVAPSVILGGTPSARTMKFMIPEGMPGESGKISSATASGLPAGVQPTITLGGSPYSRTMAFGIPAGAPGAKGDPGAPTTVNGKTGSSISLTASDVGAPSTSDFSNLTSQVTELRDYPVSPSIRIRRGNFLGANYFLSEVDTQGRPVPGLFSKEFGGGTTPPPDSGLKPTREAPTVAARRTGASFIINMSGWQTSGNVGELRGAQIKDGVALHNLTLNDWQDSEAIGVTALGEFKFYSARRGETTAQMVSDGVWNSWSFGPIIREDGSNTNLDDPFWDFFANNISGRQVVGVLNNGNFAALTITGKSSVSGLSGKNVQTLVQQLGFKSAINMDGGGSTQSVADGVLFNASSDAGGFRGIPDFMIVNAPVQGSPPPEKIPLQLASGVIANSVAHTPTLTYRGGVVNVDGAVKGTAGGIVAGGATVASIAEPFRPGVEQATSTRGNGSRVRKVVVDTGELGVYFPPALTEEAGNYNFLSNLNWETSY